ncbi:glycosyltransferase [uncultured Aquimarina sp.]|uniref:glycosyltransferase family 2 protein n=1 Tax=uncultured Aquimarina sp. TaxID=575652 RepID=UPI002613BEDE|nr:glycosyltransferase [uncultured Aquimarina sp.]
MKTKELPLISVIIPIYNSEKYLDKCIRSIIGQTYSHLQILLVNDGSTDGSLDICKHLEKEDNRITVIDIPNGGVSNARNTGISMAKGTYLQFIDSDDYVDGLYIEHLFNTIQREKAQLSVCAIESLNTDGHIFDKWEVEESTLHFDHINKDVFLELIQKFLLFGPVNKLYKTDIVVNNGISFDRSLSYGEDLLFNFEYFKHINSIAVTNKVVYKYVHDNQESLSKKRYHNKTELAKRIHFVLLDFFDRIQLTDKESLGVLYNRLFDYFYNEIFIIVNDIGFTFREKYKEIKILLKEKELTKSYEYLFKEKYASWIVLCMKHKMVFSFLICNSILKTIKTNTK